MNIQEMQSELSAAVDSPNGYQRVEHFLKKAKNEKRSMLRDALLATFEEKNYPVQQAAGGILWKLKPKYNRDLKKDLRAFSKGWDVSVEELPWYLAEATSVEQVRSATKEVMKDLTEDEAKRLDTVLYWLAPKNPERIKTQLTNRWKGRIKG